MEADDPPGLTMNPANPVPDDDDRGRTVEHRVAGAEEAGRDEGEVEHLEEQDDEEEEEDETGTTTQNQRYPVARVLQPGLGSPIPSRCASYCTHTHSPDTLPPPATPRTREPVGISNLGWESSSTRGRPLFSPPRRSSAAGATDNSALEHFEC